MKIFINDKETNTSSTNLSELATELSLPQKGVAMAIDKQMIPRDNWGSTPLYESMKIIIIKAVFGG